MKRFFTAFLAITCFVPVYGSVFAFGEMEMSHTPSLTFSESQNHDEMEGQIGILIGATRSQAENLLDTEVPTDTPESLMTEIDLTDTVCNGHTSNSSTDMDCCNPELTHTKIGIWEKGSTEKTIISHYRQPFPTFRDASYSNFVQHTRYYSTAPPPNFQNYSHLVGIVKRLD